MSTTALPKNIALSPYGYWPRTKWQRFCEFIQFRLRPNSNSRRSSLAALQRSDLSAVWTKK